MNKFEEGLSKYLNKDQLKVIQSQKIGIGGAGGLGSNVAMILVRTGFKNFEIIDQDVIEPSNLNRQQFFLNEIGQDKAFTLTRRLRKINPDANIISRKIQWTETNANEFFSDCAMIIEAFDQVDWKYRFIQHYQNTLKPVISGNGMAGLFEKKPMTVRKLGNIYFVGDNSTDTDSGHPPLAPRVTACAAKMAEIALDLTLGILPGP